MEMKWQEIRERLQSLDDKVFSPTANWGRRIGLGALVGTIVAASGWAYDTWRKGPIHIDSNTVAPRYFNPESAKQANSMLLNFPDEIPGAADINKYITPDAQYLLVHIRQNHMPSEEKRSDFTKEELDSIRMTQDNIYEILSHLHKQGTYNQEGRLPVYAEGQLGDIPAYAEVLDAIEQIEAMKQAFLEDNIGTAQDWYDRNHDIIGYFQKLKDYYEGIEKQRATSDNSIDKLVLEGKVEERGFEDIRNYRIAMMAKDEGFITADTVYDPRENSFIERAVKHDDPMMITVLGGDHAFGGEESFGDRYEAFSNIENEDNVATWNKNNPDRKISLIEITPVNYGKGLK